MEGSPEVGVDTIEMPGGTGTSKKCALGTRKGRGFAILTQERLIKHFHEFGAAGIIHFPESWQQ
jgi:hypothetical protein